MAHDELPQRWVARIALVVGALGLVPSWIESLRAFGMFEHASIPAIFAAVLGFLIRTSGILSLLATALSGKSKALPAATWLILWLPLQLVVFVVSDVLHWDDALRAVGWLCNTLAQLVAYFGVFLTMSNAACVAARTVWGPGNPPSDRRVGD